MNFVENLMAQIDEDKNFIYNNGKYVSKKYNAVALFDNDLIILTTLENKFAIDNIAGI